MSHPAANLFNLHLAKAYRIFDRKDTIRAFEKATDKQRFRDNLDAACRRAAFDKTVADVARQFKTNDVDKIAAILRRAKVVYLPKQNTVIVDSALH